MKLPAYPRTKPSGVEWLGDVPEHWEIVPFKHRCRRFAIYGANMSSDEYVPDGVRFLRTTDIDDFGRLQADGVFIEPEQAQKYLLNDQDILLSRSGTLGRAFIYSAKTHPACAYAGYLVRFVPSPRLNTRFLFHFTKSLPFADWLQTQLISSTIGNVNGQKYAQCPLPLPERPEQDAIAAYLDRETGRLDRLVGRKRELTERLKEKRTALISRTVTRGLPPAAARAAGLPENPPLKPSGLDWLGDIPKHWDTMMLKRTWAICEYGISESLSGEGSIRVLTMGNIQDGSVLIPNEGCLDGVPNNMLLKDGDLLFNRTNSMAHVGKVGIFRPISGVPVSFASYLVRLRTNARATPEFMNYLLNTSQVLDLGRSLALPSINQANLNPTRYGQISVPLPPRPEQAAIAAYLDSETAKLDALVGKVEAAVERLQEYRTALITAAVTGKIDVRKANP